MKLYGLTGFPLTHSFSKKYFEEKFKREDIRGVEYQLFPLASIDKLPSLLKRLPDLAGLNVTIPYKESVITFLDETTEDARMIGAVNCIKIENGKLKGFNTDVYGFEQSLSKFLNHAEKDNANPRQAFVLGSGGSSKAVIYVLRKMEIPFQVVSREPKNEQIEYSQIEKNMKSSNLFINTTPLGMFPQINQSPEIPWNRLSSNDFLFDLIYNPEETLFLQRGKAKGARINNGLQMLVLQAEKSWEIWSAH